MSVELIQLRGQSGRRTGHRFVARFLGRIKLVECQQCLSALVLEDDGGDWAPLNI